ncbi:DUF3696 domain-containing protein [Aeromonas veronii]|uniref:AAA family ATPase n=1 Tax=Aeromonas veronii TaxID=654 RepID=UPI0038F423DA
MINKITISGFKKFTENEFDLSMLTVLTGLNGYGKTSLIQAILLAWAASRNEVVKLNGPFGLQLGVAGKVRNWDYDRDIAITLDFDDASIHKCVFRTLNEDDLFLRLDEHLSEIRSENNLNAKRYFSYLCAERLGPRSILGSSPEPDDELEVGVHGEYCAQMIGTLGDKPIEDITRLHPDNNGQESTLLKYEIERWLKDIAKQVEISTTQFQGTSATAINFRTIGGEWVSAPNMGFGISYSLPVILCGLTARSGGVILIENPEAHLHPAGQSKMGEFLGWLAGKGIQIIVETHSDHVLNGIRKSIAINHHVNNRDVLTYYFDDSEEGVNKLSIEEDGSISSWPRGFFDQYHIDVSTLGRIRRGRA